MTCIRDDAAVGSAIGLQFILSEDIKIYFYSLERAKRSSIRYAKKLLLNILLNWQTGTRKRDRDPYLHTSTGVTSAQTDLFLFIFFAQ